MKVVNGLADLSPVLNSLGEAEHAQFKIYDFTDNKYHKVRDYFPD